MRLFAQVDSVGGSYLVVGVGLEDEARLTGECIAALCSLALRMQARLIAGCRRC